MDGLTCERQTDGHIAEETVRWMPDEGQRQRRRDRHDRAGWQGDPSVIREPKDPLLPVVRPLASGPVLRVPFDTGRFFQQDQAEQQQKPSSRHLVVRSSCD